MISLNYSSHAVIAVRAVNGGLFELAVERSAMEFSPGDCVAIYTERGISRPYSIASGSCEPELRFVIRRMENGEVSPWLMSRKAGDLIRISPPFGWFRPGQDIEEAPFVFMATGTGVAPFLSYMYTFERPPACCLYGVRREADAIGFSRLRAFCPARLAVSREPSVHYRGRITGLLEQIPVNRETHYYCCGLESMTKTITAWLRKKGVALKRIHCEVFFHGWPAEELHNGEAVKSE